MSTSIDDKSTTEEKTFRSWNSRGNGSKTKEMRESFSFVPNGKKTSLRKKLLCKATTTGPKITLRHFTKVRNVCVDELVGQTHFSTLEVCLMLEIFSRLTKRNSKHHQMTQYLENRVLRQFLIENFKITDEFTLMSLVATISQNDKFTSPGNFVKSFSTILRGDLKEKAEFAFKIFDKDNNGYLTKSIEFAAAMGHLFKVFNVADEPLFDPEQPIREIMEYLQKKFDRHKKNDISFDDYFETILEEPLLMECFFSVFPAEEIINTFQRIYLCGSKKQFQSISLIGK